MLGYHKNPYPFYRKADLYVCSSYFEGYSTSCVEAIYFGLPVLTTRCAGMDEILNSGKFGMIVDNTTDALCNGLECILSNRSLKNTKGIF